MLELPLGFFMKVHLRVIPRKLLYCFTKPHIGVHIGQLRDTSWSSSKVLCGTPFMGVYMA